MNIKQNATIPDGFIVLQILIRFWAGFQYYQSMSGALIDSDISLPFCNGFDLWYWKNTGNGNNIESFITNKLYYTGDFFLNKDV